MLQFDAVQRVAHTLENVFDLLRRDRMPLTESGVNLLFEGRDVLTALVRAAVDGTANPEGADEYVIRLEAFAGVYEATAEAIEGPRAAPADDELTPVDDAQVAAFEAEVARLLADAHVRPAAPETRAAVEAPVQPAAAPAGPPNGAGAEHDGVRRGARSKTI